MFPGMLTEIPVVARSAFCGLMTGPEGAQTSSEVKGLVELESIWIYCTVLL